jgi:predicted ArsR family transcriptional regulator
VTWSRGSGEVAYVYELTSEAKDIFAKAYDPILYQLLDALSEHMTFEEMEGVMCKVEGSIAEK